MRLIDESFKKELYAAIQKMLEDWSKEKVIDKPRDKLATVAQGTANGIHWAFSIMVGNDRQEISQMVDEIALIHDKFIPDTYKDKKVIDDFKEKRYRIG